MDVEVLHFFGCQKSLERLEKAQQRSQKTVGQNKLEKDKTSDARQQGNVIDISITIIVSNKPSPVLKIFKFPLSY